MKLIRNNYISVIYAIIIFSAGLIAPVNAQSYASGKVINFIVPYSAGGTSDTAARILADALEKDLGAVVQVVNRPGAASQVGLTELVNARPDGLTLSYGVLPTLLTHYLDPERAAPYSRDSFVPIAMHYQVPNLFAVSSSSPLQTIDDLITAAKAAPSTIRVSDTGVLGAPHLLVLRFQEIADVEFASVHFQGGAPATTALLGGHVEVLSNAISDVMPYVKTGEFRVLGIADTSRSDMLSDVPTMTEQGVDVVGVSSTVLLAPAGLDESIAAELSAAMERIVGSEAHKARLVELGIEPRFENSDTLQASWAEYEEQVAAALEDTKE